MSSRLEGSPRRVPQQERGERRVAALLDAAASLIADVGYEAATMSEIAERAGACIGSLYQFFPNKESITEALLSTYKDDARTLWSALEENEPASVKALVAGLIAESLEFADSHPAMLPLFSAPLGAPDLSIRNLLRERLTRLLLAVAPHLPKTKTSIAAVVVLQVLKGMNELYAQASASKGKALVAEYERALVCFLRPSLKAASYASRSRNKG